MIEIIGQACENQRKEYWQNYIFIHISNEFKNEIGVHKNRWNQENALSCKIQCAAESSPPRYKMVAKRWSLALASQIDWLSIFVLWDVQHSYSYLPTI